MTGAPSPKRCAEICAAAYDPAAPAVIERGDVKVIRRELPGLVAYATRGTRITNLEDVRRDLDCLPVEYPGLGHLHDGFARGALLVLDELAAAIAGETLPVWLLGHSLGAAMALDQAAMLQLRSIAVAGAVTFGCPRPGFSTLRALLQDLPGWDFRHGDDPITEIPPGFWHARPTMVPLGRVAIGDILDPLHDHYEAGYIAAAPEAMA